MPPDIRTKPSVLDRLLNEEEPWTVQSRGIRYFKEAVKRDIQWLLNTRQTVDGIPPDLKELSSSVAAYGLPDFTTFNPKNLNDQATLRKLIETAIRTFEPRLEHVVVRVLPLDETTRLLHFRIDGRLKIEPVPEPVSFDTHLDIDRGEIELLG